MKKRLIVIVLVMAAVLEFTPWQDRAPAAHQIARLQTHLTALSPRQSGQ